MKTHTHTYIYILCISNIRENKTYKSIILKITREYGSTYARHYYIWNYCGDIKLSPSLPGDASLLLALCPAKDATIH